MILKGEMCIKSFLLHNKIYCILIKSYFHSTMKHKVHFRLTHLNDCTMHQLRKIGFPRSGTQFSSSLLSVSIFSRFVELLYVSCSIMSRSSNMQWQPSENCMHEACKKVTREKWNYSKRVWLGRFNFSILCETLVFTKHGGKLAIKCNSLTRS